MAQEPPRIRLIIHDWAGTIIDFGSLAPLVAFVEVFSANGILVSADEARAPMGLHKKDHLLAMLRNPDIRQRWHDKHARDWNDSDVERMYQELIPAQLASIERRDRLIPGWVEVTQDLRTRGILLAGTTGYFAEAVERCLAAARRQGYVPDANTFADEVSKGRPAPWMIYRLMEQMGVYPPSAVLKVGDTRADIEEGRNAGVWSVGVSASSNEMGLDERDFVTLSEEDRRERLAVVAERFHAWGAQAVIDTIEDLPALVDEINQLLEDGQQP